MKELLVEKYRPKKFEDWVGNNKDVEILKDMVRKEKNIPHLLLVGSPGTGKTSLAYIIKNELDAEMMEINASDDRGIDVIRGKVKFFVKTGGVKFKILLLDEADMLTEESQHALRRMMEKYSQSCRFILTANYENKIIDAIKSRVKVIRLERLTKENIKTILKRVIDGEGILIDSNVIDRLAELANGDARKAINILESGLVDKKFDSSTLEKVGDVGKMLNFLLEGRFEDSLRELDLILQTTDEREVINLIFNSLLLNTPQINNKIKYVVGVKLAEYEDRLTRSAYPYIQLYSLLVELMYLFRKGSEQK